MHSEIKKDYKSWHIFKEKLDSSEAYIDFHEREIWWCALGLNIGIERDGKNDLFERPVLVIKKYNKEQLTILPVTTNIGKTQYDIPISLISIPSAVTISHIRTISSKRLLRKVGTLSKTEYAITLFHLIKTLLA
jgi:mRNA interferase MazF